MEQKISDRTVVSSSAISTNVVKGLVVMQCRFSVQTVCTFSLFLGYVAAERKLAVYSQ